MQRLLFTTIIPLALAAPALADGFKWNPSGFDKEAYAVGDKFVTRGESRQKNQITVDGNPIPGASEGNTSATYQLAHEVLAVDEQGKISEERIKVEGFSLVNLDAPDAAPDTSLLGHTLHVWRANKAKQERGKLEIEDDADHAVSPAARQWADAELKRGGGRNEAMNLALLPKEPVGDGAEWDGDPQVAADAILKGAKIDPAKSKVHGKLSGVREVDGRHRGKLEFEVELQVVTMPTPAGPIPFTEGGLMRVTISGEGDLEGMRADSQMIMELEFVAKAEIKQADQVQALAFDQHMKKSEQTTPAR